MSNTLWAYSWQDVTLEAALQAVKDFLKDSVGLLYSPQACKFVKTNQEVTLIDSSNKIVSLSYLESAVFEARFFNKTGELRWLNDSNGTGKAVLISEQELQELNAAKIPSTINIIDSIDQQYLLWGQQTNATSNPGWQRFASARIGALDIPYEGNISKQRVYLQTREYLAEIDDYGNVDVIEERLIRLIAK